MTVKVWFLRQDGLIPNLARALLFSPWDEVAIEYNNVFYLVDPVNGVITLDRPAFERQHPKRTFSYLKVEDPNNMVFFLNQQIERPFDWCCYMPFFRKVHWSIDRWWFSSELAACALKKAGVDIDLTVRRCTPRQLWHQLPKVVVNQHL